MVRYAGVTSLKHVEEHCSEADVEGDDEDEKLSLLTPVL